MMRDQELPQLFEDPQAFNQKEGILGDVIKGVTDKVDVVKDDLDEKNSEGGERRRRVQEESRRIVEEGPGCWESARW